MKTTRLCRSPTRAAHDRHRRNRRPWAALEAPGCVVRSGRLQAMRPGRCRRRTRRDERMRRPLRLFSFQCYWFSSKSALAACVTFAADCYGLKWRSKNSATIPNSDSGVSVVGLRNPWSAPTTLYSAIPRRLSGAPRRAVHSGYRVPDKSFSPCISSIGGSSAVTYAIGFALASFRDVPVSGRR